MSGLFLDPKYIDDESKTKKKRILSNEDDFQIKRAPRKRKKGSPKRAGRKDKCQHQAAIVHHMKILQIQKLKNHLTEL